MPQLAILILAAGTSSRMGGIDKLMQEANGTPLLERVFKRATGTGLPVYVTVPDLSHPRAALVMELGGNLIPVPDCNTGMAASIRAGVRALPKNTSGIMILPADMPDLQTNDLQIVAHAAKSKPDAIIRATTPDGRPGHPVVLPAALFEELLTITGDQGARAVVAAHKDRVIPQIIPGNNARVDLDTPADWAAWRQAQQEN